MPIGPNTRNNIGVRRTVRSLSQARNFEPNGAQLYVVVRAGSYSYGGSVYTKGQTIPYDAGTKYSAWPQLARDFSLGWVDPAD
jgi:hypothetical protein